MKKGINAERERAKTVMADNDLTFAGLAELAGLSLRTVHGNLAGTTNSTRARQAITDALKAHIWEGVVPQRTASFSAGTSIEFVTDEPGAVEFASEMGDSAERNGCTVTLLEPVKLIFSDPPQLESNEEVAAG